MIMDVLGASPVKTKRIAGTRRNKNKALKVVYISNPMKVKTSASNFRALVQELTGRDSDVAERLTKTNGVETSDHFGSLDSVPDHHLRAGEYTARGFATLSAPFPSTCFGEANLLHEPCSFYDAVPMAPYGYSHESFASGMFPSTLLNESTAGLDAK